MLKKFIFPILILIIQLSSLNINAAQPKAEVHGTWNFVYKKKKPEIVLKEGENIFKAHLIADVDGIKADKYLKIFARYRWGQLIIGVDYYYPLAKSQETISKGYIKFVAGDVLYFLHHDERGDDSGSNSDDEKKDN